MGNFAKGELNGIAQKGNLEMGEKAEVLMRILYGIGGNATFEQIYNEIPMDILEKYNWNKKINVMALL